MKLNNIAYIIAGILLMAVLVYASADDPVPFGTNTTDTAWIGGVNGIGNFSGDVWATNLYGNLNSSYVTNPFWVEVGGDNMTGNLDMSDNDVASINSLEFHDGGYIRDNGTALILGHT